MDLKKIKRNKEKFILLVVIFQIFLLINMITANSYLIHQTNPLLENLKISEKTSKIKTLINSGLTLLIGFLSIKQIGIVSAQEEAFWCCGLTNEEATCQNIPVNDDSSCDGEVWLTNCESTELCKTGTCIDKEEGICSVGTKYECGENWDSHSINDIDECKFGCCTLENGAYKEFIRKIQCTKKQGNFDSSTTQQDCRIYTEEMGACVLDDGNCKFVTEENCELNLKGQPNPGLLCSNPSLGTRCGRPLNEEEIETTCYNNKVYFLDNCSEISNVYDAAKWNIPDYWKVVQDSSCGDGKESLTCGNCDGLNSICTSSSKAGVNPTYGNYACKDLTCIDENGNTRQNWESWCVYESYVGDSKDVVGSEHRLRWCEKGEIKYDLCSNYRGKICGENITSEGFSVARCRFNEGWKCLQLEPVSYEYNDDGGIINQEKVNEYKYECGNMSDCRIQSVDVDDYFKFDLCVPKYPKGFDITPESSSEIDSYEKLCGIASIKCPVIYEKRLNAENECKRECKEEYENRYGNCPRKACRVACRKKCRLWPLVNENCATKEFAEQMNDFCISLGDCGGYVNVEGEYEKNFKVSEEGYQEDLDNDKINEYKSYAVEGEGDFPQFFSSAEHGYWGGDPLKEFEVGGVKDISNLIPLIGLIIGAPFDIGTTLILAAVWDPEPITKIIVIVAAVVILIITAIVSALGIREIQEITIEFTCMPWQPPSGGNDCDECNNDLLRPCTEYKCESLGAGCELIDKNELYESEKSVCKYQHENDVTPPQIVFGEIDNNLYSVTDKSDGNGVRIRTSGGDCIQEFTAINFSLKTEDGNEDDYARCVYNWENVEPPNPSNAYSLNGEYFKEGNYYSITHTFTKEQERLPFVSSLDDVTGNLGEREGELNMHVRCMDKAGNSNVNEYLINFCIKEGPDNTIAEIIEYTPETGSFLLYGANESYLQILLDEPADCKWTHDTDKLYENMENDMSCEDYTEEIKSSWICSTELTSLTKSENKIYIKCKDQPWISEEGYEGLWTEENRNVNAQGFLYTLYSTENELTITSLFPQGNIIVGGEVTEIKLEVITSGGMSNGISECKYEFIDSPLNISVWDFFPEIDSYHIYPLNLPSGSYNILVTCEDAVGNKAQKNSVFSLTVDSSPPIIVRAYQEGGKLTLITNENAKCYYDFDKCNFYPEDKEGTEYDMTTAFSTIHTATWNNLGVIYHIKCEDLWGNINPYCAKKIIPSY